MTSTVALTEEPMRGSHEGMARRSSMEDVMEELYRQGLSGDEEAQLDFITFIVTETELPMPDMAEVWLRRLAEKGIDQARRCYFSWAMAGGGGENHDWLKVEQWLLGMEAETPGAAHAMLGMLYDPAFPGFTDWKLAAQYYRKAVDAGNAGCGFYQARVYRGHGEEAGVSHEEMRELLERAEPVNACGQLYELLCASCEVLEDYDTAMKYYKRGTNMTRKILIAVSAWPVIMQWDAG